MEQLNITDDEVAEGMKERETKKRYLKQLLLGSIKRRRMKIFVLGNNKKVEKKMLLKKFSKLIQLPIDDSKKKKTLEKYNCLHLSYWKINKIDFTFWGIKNNSKSSGVFNILLNYHLPAIYFVLFDLRKPLNPNKIINLLGTIQKQGSGKKKFIFFIARNFEKIKNKTKNVTSLLLDYSNQLKSILISFKILLSPSNSMKVISSGEYLFWPILNDKEIPKNQYNWYLTSNSVTSSIKLNENSEEKKLNQLEEEFHFYFEKMKNRVIEIGEKWSKIFYMPLTYAKLFKTIILHRQTGLYSIIMPWFQFQSWGKANQLFNDDLHDSAVFLHNWDEVIYFNRSFSSTPSDTSSNTSSFSRIRSSRSSGVAFMNNYLIIHPIVIFFLLKYFPSFSSFPWVY